MFQYRFKIDTTPLPQNLLDHICDKAEVADAVAPAASEGVCERGS